MKKKEKTISVYVPLSKAQNSTSEDDGLVQLASETRGDKGACLLPASLATAVSKRFSRFPEA